MPSGNEPLTEPILICHHFSLCHQVMSHYLNRYWFAIILRNTSQWISFGNGYDTDPKIILKSMGSWAVISFQLMGIHAIYYRLYICCTVYPTIRTLYCVKHCLTIFIVYLDVMIYRVSLVAIWILQLGICQYYRQIQAAFSTMIVY